MTPERLLELIQAGESLDLEFKGEGAHSIGGSNRYSRNRWCCSTWEDTVLLIGVKSLSYANLARCRPIGC